MGVDNMLSLEDHASLIKDLLLWSETFELYLSKGVKFLWSTSDHSIWTTVRVDLLQDALAWAHATSSESLAALRNLCILATASAWNEGSISSPRIELAPNDSAARRALPLPQVGSKHRVWLSQTMEKK